MAKKKPTPGLTKFDNALIDQVREQQAEPRPAVVDISAMQDQVKKALLENSEARRRLLKLKTELTELANQQAKHNEENTTDE